MKKKISKLVTSNVDTEISSIAGPQLVVPVDNARYALNAANALWGSLYDALYGTDVIPGKIDKVYDESRGQKVIKYTRDFLDNVSPLDSGSWKEITKIKIDKNNLCLLINDKEQTLKNKNQFIGFLGEKDNPNSILLKNNNLHIDIKINPNSNIGKKDKAGIIDIVLESAISTIIDNEDSVAAVDGADKVNCYRNLVRFDEGRFKTEVVKNGKNLFENLTLIEIIHHPMDQNSLAWTIVVT